MTQGNSAIAKTNKEKILEYVETRKGGEKVKLNDFLKSLWPLVPNEPPPFTRIENVRSLRRDLIDLATSGKIKFLDNSYQRLGKSYWPDNSGITKYYDLTNLVIEADLSQNV